MDIFIVWNMNADSWSGLTTLVSIHKTLEGARATIDDNLKTDTYTGKPFGSYIENYTYFAIEKRAIQD